MTPTSAKKRVLLLNPPGRRLYVRDYYCSKVSKADYINSPIDLVMISGILNTPEFELEIIDAIIDKLPPAGCLEKINSLKPDIIIALIGSVSLEEDIGFLKELAGNFTGEIFVIGDFLLTENKRFLSENPFVKGAILNFISPGIYYYLKGEKEKACDLVCREGEDSVVYPPSDLREFTVNIPRHEEFIKNKYSLPFSKHLPFATTLTSYGCPFQCTFCVMNTFKYVERNLDNLFEELDYLKNLGVKEICFLDQTLGVNRERLWKILNGIIERQYNFSWSAFTRVDRVDEELLMLIKKAGCHTLMLGVESANDEILKKYKKGYNKDQVTFVFKAARKAGIKTLATFLLGFPEENKEMIERTVNFAIELDPDYASFNFAVPRFGTEFREMAIREGLASPNEKIMNQSGQEIAMATKNISREELRAIRKKAIRKFYFRPGYVLKRLISIRSFTELKLQLKNVFSLIKNY